jgi:WhiB family transcriptional regulator, redox-sensing transcriptional regulator
MFAKELYETTSGDVDWSDAACRAQNGLTDLFFSELIPEINRAKAICQACPLLEPCLRGAVLRREPTGVWGGQLFANGHILAQKRKRGRPPKVRPPEPELNLLTGNGPGRRRTAPAPAVCLARHRGSPPAVAGTIGWRDLASRAGRACPGSIACRRAYRSRVQARPARLRLPARGGLQP